MTTPKAPTIQSVRLNGEQWAAALAQVSTLSTDVPSSTSPVGEPAAAFRAGPKDTPSPVDLLLRHGSAPVRASLVATAGSRGSIARASLVDDEALVIVQAIAERDGRILIEPGAELRLASPQTLWPALQAAIPPRDVLRAPANAVGHQSTSGGTSRSGSQAGTDIDDGAPWPGVTLDDADAVLQVVVEARPGPGRLAGFWSRLWAVAGDTLFDVERRDGTLTRTPRPAGSVAAELQWALAGAMSIALEGDR